METHFGVERVRRELDGTKTKATLTAFGSTTEIDFIHRSSSTLPTNKLTDFGVCVCAIHFSRYCVSNKYYKCVCWGRSEINRMNVNAQLNEQTAFDCGDKNKGSSSQQRHSLTQHREILDGWWFRQEVRCFSRWRELQLFQLPSIHPSPQTTYIRTANRLFCLLLLNRRPSIRSKTSRSN